MSISFSISFFNATNSNISHFFIIHLFIDHGIHHMFPGKHWSFLKVEHAERVEPHIHPALDQGSIFGYIFTTYVYPGQRVTFDGEPVPVIDDGPDQPWFYSTYESYSDRNVDERVWAKNLEISKNGMDWDDKKEVVNEKDSGRNFSKRTAKSYTLMK